MSRTIDIVNEHLPCPHCEGTGKVPNNDFIAVRMRAYREKRGVSLRKVAIQAGWSAPYLSDLETGRRIFTDEKVAKFKEAVDTLAKPEKKK